MLKKQTVLILVLVASFTILYRDVLAKLIQDWSIDENYSHGFLIAPIAAYFAWERRGQFLAKACQPNLLGLVVVLGSVGVLLLGVLGADVFTTEVSLVGTLAGSVLYLGGWARLKVMQFPIAFLLLMIPLPAIVFNEITFPLQLVASRFGEAALIMFQIPVLREGNVIQLANTSLEVAEACSGIRSLVTLLSLGIVYGYFMDSRGWIRSGLVLATVPVAIISNGLRVAGTGVAAHHFGPSVAEGFLHTFSGWLIFVAAFVMLCLFHSVLIWLFPRDRRPTFRSVDELAAYSTKS